MLIEVRLIVGNEKMTPRMSLFDQAIWMYLRIYIILTQLHSIHQASSNKNIVPFSTRIINGEKISEDVYKSKNYHVSIFNDVYRHFCGGSIISPSWILTTAHCKKVQQDNRLSGVRYGTGILRKGRIAPIKVFIAHPNYDPNFPANGFDIALVGAPLKIDGDVQPIPIYQHIVPFFEPLTVEGWGWEMSQVGTCSKVLKSAKIQRISCPISVSSTYFCAIGMSGIPCHGDSGGGVVYKGQLIGLVGSVMHLRVPNTIECDTDDVITFTNTPIFMQWIMTSVSRFSYIYNSATWNATTDDFEKSYKNFKYPDTNKEC